MLCDNCKKKEATVHIKEVHGGKCVSYNLCADCAREKEQHGELGALGFNLAEVLFNVGKLAEAVQKKQQEIPPELAKTVCPRCGWNMEKLRESGGKLGCPQCYETFAEIVNGVISHVQRGSIHCGKRPGTGHGREPAALQIELRKMQRELNALIRREEYEAAAVCRDRIKALKAELAELPGGEE